MSGRRHRNRRIVQVLVLLLGTLTPWLDLFRLDLPAGRVIYLGYAWPLEWPYVLGLIIPFVVLVWALAWLSYRRGRVFCGWACPYGSLVEFCEGLRTALGRGSNRLIAAWMRRSAGHRLVLRVGAGLTLLAGPVLLGASLAAYLIPPARVLAGLTTLPRSGVPGQAALWVWMGLVLAASWIAGFVVRFHVCRMVCIYGMGQAMAASAAEDRALRPRYRPEDLGACGACQACLKACFVDLDPRARHLQLGFSAGCFNCGDCVDVCETVQAHRGGPALLSFERGRTRPEVRPQTPADQDW